MVNVIDKRRGQQEPPKAQIEIAEYIQILGTKKSFGVTTETRFPSATTSRPLIKDNI
ncbi:MAG: hypothetical protein Q8R40_01580 [bacterium]|nr:hypothetical protein [bacterium]